LFKQCRASGRRKAVSVESILLSNADDRTSLSFIHIHAVRCNHDFLRKCDTQAVA